MDLKCKKLDCEYNKDYACMNKNVNIGNKIECQNYKLEKKHKSPKQDVSKTMFEKTPKVHPYRHNKNINITCDNSCLFNQCGNCKANGILINLEHNDCPCCNTYLDVKK